MTYEIIKKYIAHRKKTTDSTNEKEYTDLLDLETAGTKELEQFIEFVALYMGTKLKE